MNSACPVCGPEFLPFLQSRPALWAAWQTLPRRQLAKGQLLEEGGLHWVECGLLRSYWRDAQGQERNRAFHGALQWAGAPGEAGPALGLQALQPSSVLSLSEEGLRQWAAHSELGMTLTQGLLWHVREQARLEAQWRLETPQQRYQRLLDAPPDWWEQLPQHQLASYLGITPVALSRIRRRLREGA